jgi:Fe-S-cluster containining protein
MELKLKLAQLNRVYALYDQFIAGFPVACRRFCALCCTCNVAMTTLEGYLIASHLQKLDQLQVAPSMAQILRGKRFQPQTTLNTFAALCSQGQDTPEEDAPDPHWGRCPFLDQDSCSIYPVRPFGCRAMVSATDCRRNGYAAMDDFGLTVNNILLQTIEHLDSDGYSGNLSDIMRFFSDSGNLAGYRDNRLNPPADALIRNHAITVLMIPPEHRLRAEPMLRSLGFMR